MSAKKKTISRVLCLVMIVALIVPALLVVPASATVDKYWYGDYELPYLPSEVDLSVYPYAVLRADSLDKTYDLFFSKEPFVATNVLNGSGGPLYYINFSEYGSASSWNYYGQVIGTVSVDPKWPIVWSNHDIFNPDGSLYIKGTTLVSSSLLPSTPVLVTSFDGQVINVDAGSVNFYIHASNVNGNLSCEWYINGQLYGEIFDFVEIEPGVWLQGWKYTPVENGIREIYAIVKNTCGSNVASVNTGTAILNVGNAGSGGESGDSSSNAEVIEKLETLDLDISEIKSSVDDLAENVEQLPDKITDGMQDIIEQEKEQATQQGGQFVDDITGVVPNDSQGFIDALGSLVSVLSYDGTECVLPIPALTLPAIGGLFPSYTVMQAQEVDFEEFFAMMPPAIMLLVQSLLTVALIVYCFKELYDTVAYFFVLKGGNK